MPEHSYTNCRFALLPWLVMLAGSLSSQAVSAAELAYLRKNEKFCDTSGELCLHGTISYRPNSRVLQLRSRVLTAPGPGMLRINVTGENRQGHMHRATIEIEIRGRISEIVSKEMIPDAPDVYAWQLDSIVFEVGAQNET